MSPPERAYIGLGGNVGDARAAIADAVVALDALPGVSVVARSSCWRSAPIDADGGDYVNAVVAVTSRLDPHELLQQLHAIEAASGRQRSYRHAPRTLDLDLLLVGQRCIDTPALQLPHPRLHERAFVLRPLLELDPAVFHPRLGLLAALLPGVAQQSVERLDCSG